MKTKRKQKPRRTKFHYIQHWGTYSIETPIFVGYSPQEITRIIKNKKDWKQEVKDLWNERDAGELVTSGCALTIRDDGYSMVIFGKYEDTWLFWETLVHECFHLVVYIMGTERAFINHTTESIEEEGMAYAQEYLFRNIRRKLQKAFSRSKRKK